MADYRKMTVQSLKDLVRKMLGPGHSKRTKSELVALLEQNTSEGSGRISSKPEKAAARPKAHESRKTVRTSGKAAHGAAGSPAKSSLEKEPGGRAGGKAPPEADAEEGSPGAEGYFVARVRGEDAVREAPRPLTETTADLSPGRRGEPSEPSAPDEGLGDLPSSYGDDAFVALPRDPRTLFLYWDFSQKTTEAAFAGLEGARAELRLFARSGDGWELVRTVDFALESRGFYVHDLGPGRVYRAEVHVVDRHGSNRQVGSPSNEMMLPPLGPSPVIDDRFIRLPWDVPLGRLLGPGHLGGPFSEEARLLLARLSDWSRFGGGGGSLGGIGGRGQGGAPLPGNESGSGRGV